MLNHNITGEVKMMRGQVEFIHLIRQDNNGAPYRVKGLFVKSKPGMSMQDIINVAKAEARKIGMGYVEVLDVLWSENAGGWLVPVETKA